ncbi:MAG: hypothetical protein R3F34_16455 [Planctomycetota bacterium]
MLRALITTVFAALASCASTLDHDDQRETEGGDRPNAIGEESSGKGTVDFTDAASHPSSELDDPLPALTEVENSIAGGDLERAETLFAALVEPGVVVLLETLPKEQRIDVARRIDAVAWNLDLLDVDIEACEFVVAKLERRGGEPDAELVLAWEAPGSTSIRVRRHRAVS